MPASCRLALLTLLVVGCLPAHDQPRLPLSEDAPLELRDAAGSAWPFDMSPRQPTLRLWLDAPSAPGTRVLLWLLSGPVSDATLADLGHEPVRERTRARIVPVTVSVGPRYVDVRPSTPLPAAQRFSLVWQTALGYGVRTLRTSGAPSAGADFVGSLPADGARNVPPDQSALLWLFDADVTAYPGAEVVLAHDGAAERLPLDGRACTARSFAASRCLSATLTQPLVVEARYTATLERGPRDRSGASLAVPPLTFAVAKRAADAPPELAPARCTVGEEALGPLCARFDERTVQVRARCDRPASLCLTGCGDHACALSALSEARLVLTRQGQGACPAVLRVEDGAGLRRDLAIRVPDAPALPTISVSKVHAHGSGEDALDEYVELLNFGGAPVPLTGLTLVRNTETRGVTFDEPSPVDAGERVLVVSPDYAGPAGKAGAGPSLAVRVVRLARALGLSASGTALTLTDAEGRFVSGAPAAPTPFPGACLVRHDADPRRADESAFELRDADGCAPGDAPAADAPAADAPASAMDAP